MLKEARDIDGAQLGAAELSAVAAALPERFWLTELTIPHLLYGRRRKLGDFVTSAGPQDPGARFDSIRFAWLPGLMWFDRHLRNGPFNWSFRSHIPVARTCNETRPELEW